MRRRPPPRATVAWLPLVAVLLAPAADAWGACPIYTQAQCISATPATSCPAPGAGVTCIVSGWDPTPANRTVTMGGRVQYQEVCVVCGGQIRVTPYDNVAANKTTKGNLEIVAQEIFVDANYDAGVVRLGSTPTSCTPASNPPNCNSATSCDCPFERTCTLGGTATLSCRQVSSISGRGAGYHGKLCGDGPGPYTASGGRGGCALRDSGGGGGHFGGGGRGTKDCPSGGCSFPHDWEEDCTNSLNGAGTACSNTSNCWNYDGLPTVAGQSYRHSVWQIEFGAAGGDKGCRDGDGFPLSGLPGWIQAGSGGGRVVLAGRGGAGLVHIEGKVSVDGEGGCGNGNDSAGGGAGGTLLVVGDQVIIGDGALLTAAGGQGGDTQGLVGTTAMRRDCPNVPRADCPYTASTTPTSAVCIPQQGGTCDDCAGGGGGGVINVLSTTVATISQTAQFHVNGAKGGSCGSCTGEAGGAAGELQIEGAYVGEICDGLDNDFDGQTDNGLPTTCSGSNTWRCVNGVPEACLPTAPACVGPVTDTRARFAVVVDTSGSMLMDVAGNYTFGDGSSAHPGNDMSNPADGKQNDSRLYKAKAALTNVIAAYPEIDFALARYHQDQAENQSCQLAHWFECQGLCCSYDNPVNNTAPAATPACQLQTSGTGTMTTVNMHSPGDECINYAGSCGAPRRGADFVVGFGRPIEQYLMWIDGGESSFVNTTAAGDYCIDSTSHALGDCEFRASGPTPLSGSLEAAYDYLRPFQICDGAAIGGCRKYSVILLTDGAESCAIDAASGQIDTSAPVTSAAKLLAAGIKTYVIGFSVLTAERTQLNAIAAAGGTSQAVFVGNETDLANTLAQIVAAGIIRETCNGLDDDCDGLTDEDWPQKNLPLAARTCTVGTGLCLRSGHWICKPDGSGVCCGVDDGSGRGLGTCLSPGPPAPSEVCCNGVDDNCNGITDEGCSCVEICDGVDNDGNGQTDEGFPVGQPCDNGLKGACYRTGTLVCSADHLSTECNAAHPAPTDETCDCVDNNCNGLVDEGVQRDCYTGATGTRDVGICHGGFQVCATVPGPGCVPDVWSAQCMGEQTPKAEECNNLDDDCNGLTDDGLSRGYYTGPPATRGVGECHDGTEVCTAGTWGATVPQVVPTQELCNGKDDDCNGLTDDGLAAVPCYDGGGECDLATGQCLGQCRPGAKACVDAQFGACQGQVLPVPETCNGLDDNCDGETDNPPPGEQLPGVGVACVTPGGCPGVTVCDATQHTILCKSQSPDVEICNGLDDDCDGLIDEPPGPGDPPLCDAAGLCAGTSCTPPLPPGVDHVCAEGHYECVAGAIICVGAVLPEPEVCDGKDNDCDGVIDNGDLCDPGSICYQGECVQPCKQDEFPCPGGHVCLDGADLGARQLCANPGVDVCFCVASTCLGVDCDPGWACSEADGQCHDSCAGVTCGPGQECHFGVCVDCTILGCPAGQACAAGQCVDNPCAGKDCPAGTYCTAGACVPRCDALSCPAGTSCRGGQCLTDGCGAQTCSYAQYCDPETGTCESDPCMGVVCGTGAICAQKTGQCVPDPCLVTSCGLCEECRADPYWQVATCEWMTACTSNSVYATGGGCAAAGGAGSPAGPAALLLLLPLAALGLRRRGGGR